MILESMELFPLWWIGEIVYQHVINRTVSNCNFPTVNLILNVGIPDVYVFFAVVTWFTPIILQQDCTIVVRIEDWLINTKSLVWQEILSPCHLWGGVIYSKISPLGGSGGIDLLFLWNDGSISPSNGYSGASLTFEIIIDITVCVNLPMNNI